MTDSPALDGLLRRALLAYNARALHTDVELPRRGVPVLDHGSNPLGQPGREREELVDIACHGLAHALLAGPTGRVSEEAVHCFLDEQWTASLLAWSQVIPARLDAVSPPCACGVLGTRPVPVLTEGS